MASDLPPSRRIHRGIFALAEDQEIAICAGARTFVGHRLRGG